jgi:hypothetical protein
VQVLSREGVHHLSDAGVSRLRQNLSDEETHARATVGGSERLQVRRRKDIQDMKIHLRLYTILV